MANEQWLILAHEQRLDVCNLGGDPTPEEIEDLSRRARVLAGVPAEDDTPGIVSVSPGQPHPQTMRRAHVRELRELTGVSQSAVDAYCAGQAGARRRALEEAVEVTERALARMNEAPRRD